MRSKSTSDANQALVTEKTVKFKYIKSKRTTHRTMFIPRCRESINFTAVNIAKTLGEQLSDMKVRQFNHYRLNFGWGPYVGCPAKQDLQNAYEINLNFNMYRYVCRVRRYRK